MPTIHLSLPEGVYRELRKYADYMGVQITDLVKFMINKGLEELRQRIGKQQEVELEGTLKLILASIEKVEKKMALMELRLREQEIKFKEYIDNIESKISDLELAIQEVQEPVLEPEILKTRHVRKQRI